MTFTVGLDVSALNEGFKSHAQRGIGRYVRELKRYFERVAETPALKVDFFDQGKVCATAPKLLRGLARGASCLPVGRATMLQQVLFPVQLALARGQTGKPFDTLHFPAHMDPPAWGIKRYILTVLDLIPLVCADLYKANKSSFRFHFARWLELRAVQNAALILCISENTARDVNRILNVPWERLVVTPLGVDEKFFNTRQRVEQPEVLRRLGIPLERPKILYVGGIDPRKNYGILIAAFKQVLETRRSQGQTLPVLIMAGGIQADREFPRLQALVVQHDLLDSVIMPGFVAEEDLLQLYAASAVFFFPSLYEGFGLPPLEALAAGLPVVSSNSSALPEVLGNAALTFAPQDFGAAAQALLAVLENDELARRLAAQGPIQARNFTWERTGQATFAAYERFARGLNG